MPNKMKFETMLILIHRGYRFKGFIDYDPSVYHWMEYGILNRN